MADVRGDIRLKLSISNIAWAKEHDVEVYKILKKYGFEGLEIAPTRIVPVDPYNNVHEAVEWYKGIQDTYGFELSSMQSIWYGRSEKIFGTKAEREALIEYTKSAIDYAEKLSIHNLVFGCPRNRSVDDSTDLNIGIKFFKTIGDYAAKHHTVIAMEANPVIYNTNYVNYTKDAFELVDEVNSDGFKINLDIGTMIYNEEDPAIIKDNLPKINHIHISEPGLKVIQERDLHRDIASILKAGNYDKWVSIEMGRQEDIGAIDAACAYVSELFAED